MEVYARVSLKNRKFQNTKTFQFIQSKNDCKKLCKEIPRIAMKYLQNESKCSQK
jgi:hypothetical protein